MKKAYPASRDQEDKGRPARRMFCRRQFFDLAPPQLYRFLPDLFRAARPPLP